MSSYNPFSRETYDDHVDAVMAEAYEVIKTVYDSLDGLTDTNDAIAQITEQLNQKAESSEVAAVMAELITKANQADLDNLIAVLETKSDADHTHVIAEILGLQAALDSKQPAGNYSLAGHGHAWGEISGKPATYAPSAHGHVISEVAGLQAALDGKQPAGSYSITGHSHAWTEITGKPTTFAPSAHTHSIGDVTGLQSALDGKQAAGSYSLTGHTHVIADVTGLQAALDGKQAAGSYLPTSGGTLTGNFAVNITGQAFRITQAGGFNYIQSGTALTSGSAAPLLFTTIFGSAEWARFDATGRFGIGNPSPAEKLDVTGNAKISGSLTVAGRNVLADIDTKITKGGIIPVSGSGNGSGMTGYLSFLDGGNLERGWLGFGEGNTNLRVRNTIGSIVLTASTIHIDGTVKFANTTWHTSADGKNRFYFGPSSRTYFGTGDGYEFRNSVDEACLSLNNDKSVVIYGSVNSPRVTVGSDGVGNVFYLTTTATASVINFDTNDYFSFDKTANVLSLFISGTETVIAKAGVTEFKTPVQLPSYTVAALPTAPAGSMAYVSNGRKAGEAAGAGTGVMAFRDGSAWRACDTGATVAA